MSILQMAVVASILGFVFLQSISIPIIGFVFIPWFRKRELKKQYPHVVAFGARVADITSENISTTDISFALKLFVDRCEERLGMDKKALEKELGKSYIKLIRSPNDDRRFTDEHGRLIAGDNNGGMIRAGFTDDDSLNQIAFFHECGHTADRVRGKKTDYKHRDDIMWHEVVGWCKKEFGS